jgi:predicted Zn-dependent protease
MTGGQIFKSAHGVLLLGFALTLLASCSSTPDNRIVTLPETPARNAEQQPVEARENARILASYGGAYTDAKLEASLDALVAKLAAASERPDLKYKVIVLNSPAINAFALPSGQLYITRGIIALANDTSELASVMSHEMAHVIASHASIREDQARRTVTIAAVGDMLGDPELSALALAKSKLALASFSRAQEFEADGIGVGIAARAGYDPYGAVRFLNDMQRNAHIKTGGNNEPDPRSNDFLATHPATPDRIRNALANARQFTGPGAGRRDRQEYLTNLNGIVFGEDPSEGFARGRRFLHPKLGFTFTAPPNYSLDNTAQAVLGVKDGGGQALRLDVMQVPAEQSLVDYLRSGWIENVDKNGIEELTINGFPAATASATGDQWSFRLYVVRFGSDVYRFIFASKQKTPEIERAFRESVGTFRRMSRKESQEVHPLRLRIVSVRAHDTIDTLARQMATDKKKERFMVLNGLAPGDRLTPGEQVKIVVE